MTRQILVQGVKEFRLTVPDEAKITFGPWSPGEKNNFEGNKTGTLRIYESKNANANILGVFSGVKSFREEGLGYEEKIFVEKGSTVWESDRDGYKREESVSRSAKWDNQLGDGQEEKDGSET